MPDEIILTKVEPDSRTLSIRLNPKIPTYVALLALKLPGRWITATAQAQKHGERTPPSGVTKDIHEI
jgi:hypothetical protein